MKTSVDDKLRREAARFELRFRCDDCVHFDADHARCTHEYPTAEHRRPLASAHEIVFCKEFELS